MILVFYVCYKETLWLVNPRATDCPDIAGGMSLFKALKQNSFQQKPSRVCKLCLGNNTSQTIAQANENLLVQGVPYTHPVLLYNSW